MREFLQERRIIMRIDLKIRSIFEELSTRNDRRLLKKRINKKLSVEENYKYIH